MRLEELLRQQGVAFEKTAHPTVYTAQQLAATEHVSGHCVAKPVVVSGAQGFTMCVLPASRRLDLRKVAELLGDPSVRLATEAEMAEACPDCELGAEPPVGSLFGLATILDQTLHDEEHLVLQAGTHTESLKLRRDDYERVASPKIGAIAAS